jgi:tRNA(Arg) A34 adenosine deaminase TadA
MFNKLYMQEALLEAEKAFEKGEVPIGAVVVYGEK